MIYKKGGVHVDWIISAGIFLVYIISLFMFIRPGSGPEYNEKILLEIVESNLRNEVYVNVSKTPIFVKVGGFNEYVFPFSGNQLYYNISGSSGEAISFSIGEDLVIDAFGDVNWLAYSEGVVYNHSGASCPDVLGCEEDGILYGASEIIEGVSLERVSNFVSAYGGDDGYNLLKGKWGFPDSREFSFSVVEGDDKYEYEVVKPFQQAEVFVKEWKEFVLDPSNGEIRGAVVNVRIW